MRGRPSKFTEEAIEKALSYINGGYKDRGDMIPSHIGMAREMGVSKTTIYRWAQEHEDRFAEVLELCNMEQEHVLLNNGLNGTFNSAITKLVLGKHGYSDKREHQIPNAEPMMIQIVRHSDALLNAIDEQKKPATEDG